MRDHQLGKDGRRRRSLQLRKGVDPQGKGHHRKDDTAQWKERRRRKEGSPSTVPRVEGGGRATDGERETTHEKGGATFKGRREGVTNGEQKMSELDEIIGSHDSATPSRMSASSRYDGFTELCSEDTCGHQPKYIFGHDDYSDLRRGNRDTDVIKGNPATLPTKARRPTRKGRKEEDPPTRKGGTPAMNGWREKRVIHERKKIDHPLTIVLPIQLTIITNNFGWLPMTNFWFCWRRKTS